tara:strand:+ start:664 stop:1200 length:537 start_codon:yes stop_codon:yes gene_type:complete
MARPKTKEDLSKAAKINFEMLWQTIDSMPENTLNTNFDFSTDPNKKEAHWRRDKNLRDVLIHLYEWHQLLIRWINANLAGIQSPFIPTPYNWKTYGAMNIEFWEKHQNTSLNDAKIKVSTSHDQVMLLIQKFSTEELFTKQFYNWTGTTTLGSYCVSALSSHYEWAIKKLNAHAKKFI